MELEIFPRDAAPEASQPILDGIAADLGFVPNLAATVAASPTLLAGFDGLRRRGRHVVRPRTARSPARRRVAVDNATASRSTPPCSAAWATMARASRRCGAATNRTTPHAAGMRSPGARPRLGRGRRGRRPAARHAGLTDADLLQLVAECAFASLVGLVDTSRGSRRARRVPAAPGVELTGSPARASVAIRAAPSRAARPGRAGGRRPRSSPHRARRRGRHAGRAVRGRSTGCGSLGSSTPARHEPTRRRSGTVRCTGVVEADGLARTTTPIWAERVATETSDLMLVGHLPHLGRLTSLLLGCDPESGVVRFRPGARATGNHRRRLGADAAAPAGPRLTVTSRSVNSRPEDLAPAANASGSPVWPYSPPRNPPWSPGNVTGVVPRRSATATAPRCANSPSARPGGQHDPRRRRLQCVDVGPVPGDGEHVRAEHQVVA